MDSLQASYANVGARMLDSRYPEWHKSIDLKRLNMAHCRRCVLGQLFGDYEMAVQLELAQDPYGSWAVRHGFILDKKMSLIQSLFAWRQLNRCWRQEIETRTTATPAFLDTVLN